MLTLCPSVFLLVMALASSLMQTFVGSVLLGGLLGGLFFAFVGSAASRLDRFK